MSEIDFKEIEKAMAELVNKAQDKKRQQQLKTVVKKRDEIAKKVETARGQGTVATKRIIIGNNTLRSPSVVPLERKSTPLSVSPNKNPISDFRPVGHTTPLQSMAPPPIPSQTFEKEILASTEQTVGELSDEYLQDQVSSLNTTEDLSADQTDLLEEVDSQVPDSTLDQEVDANIPLEEETTPPSSSSTLVSEDLAPEETATNQLEEELAADNLPESEELNKTLDNPNYDYGAVHRVYGQRMPRHFDSHHYKKVGNNMKPSEEIPSSVLKKNRKPKNKKSFLSFLVYFLILASVAVWAGAAYLYFIY